MSKREDNCPARAAACVLVIQHRLVLAIWNEAHGCFGLPGGKREPSDKHIRSTAYREMSEETGLIASELVWLYAAPYASLGGDEREVHLYHTAYAGGRLHPTESTLAWMPWGWLLRAAPAFRAFYEEALPDGIDHLQETALQ